MSKPKQIKIISGGQTGVDRAALDAARSLGFETGGWCPKGRLAEDGCIDSKYKLKETTCTLYQNRTEWNVRDSDGTLIIAHGKLTYGTAYTYKVCRQLNKPSIILDPQVDTNELCKEFNRWLIRNQIKSLNVAGPRQDGGQTVYRKAYKMMIRLLK